MNTLMIRSYIMIYLVLLSFESYAKPKKVTLGGSGGFLQDLTDFFQVVIDFFQGPYSVVIAFIGAVMVAIGLMFAKDASGIVGTGLRVITGVGVLFAAGGIVGSFT